MPRKQHIRNNPVIILTSKYYIVNVIFSFLRDIKHFLNFKVVIKKIPSNYIVEFYKIIDGIFILIKQETLFRVNPPA